MKHSLRGCRTKSLGIAAAVGVMLGTLGHYSRRGACPVRKPPNSSRASGRKSSGTIGL